MRRRDEDLLRMTTNRMVTPRGANRPNFVQASMNSALDLMRESARDKQESRVTMQMELEARHREERELEERRLEREHMRHVELLEREHKRHMELVALFTRGSTPQPPQVAITQPRPDGDIAVRLKVESVQQLIRCLRSSFDPEGQRIILQEEVGGPEMLVVDDVTSLNWPKELSLTMEEKLVGGSNTVVFMLRPSQ